MKKTGFTLIELIAVITILAIIIVFSVPALLNTINSNNDKKYEDFLKNLYIATENYVVLNEESYPQLKDIKGTAFIQIKTLVEKGLLKREIYNPKEKTNIKDSDTIKVVRNADNTYKYQYYNKDATTEGYTKGSIMFYDGYTKPDNNKMMDISGFGNNLTMYNFIESCWDGNSITFDGVDDYANASFFMNDKVTIELHFDSNISLSNSTKISGLLQVNTWTDQLGFTDTSILYFFDKRISAKLDARVLIPPTSTVAYSEKALPNVIDNDIKKMTMTLTLDKNKIIEYVNGEVKGSITDTNFLNRINLKEMLLNLGSYASFYTNMKLHSVRIYDKVLTEAEVKNNYEIDNIRFGE